MECPKCHRKIDETQTVCPHCHKVLALECPNCKNITQSSVCDKCGYLILVKCSKCGKMVPTFQEKCKCGMLTKTSLAYQECETDEFASIIIKFGALRSIRNLLKSQELFAKFYFRLKNLLTAQLTSVEGNVIIYNDVFVVNMNKELSFATSADKAMRLALKIINSFSNLNQNVIEEFGASLKLSVTVVKKHAEELLSVNTADNNVKLLALKKDTKKYLKGMQLIIDQFIQDSAGKNYKTDSLYSVEQDGQALMFYEVLLDGYILPPSSAAEDALPEACHQTIVKKENIDIKQDKYAFKVFDINAKCKFNKTTALNLLSQIDNNKIISVRGSMDLTVTTSQLRKYYEDKDYKVIQAVCTEALNYKPWGVFEQLYRDYYGLSTCKGSSAGKINSVNDLLNEVAVKASSTEDARFAYMEEFELFLKSLRKCVVLIEGFEWIDDTTIQALELYFDKFSGINANFVFVTDSETPLHSKIKGLLRTSLYTEYSMQQIGIDDFWANIKEEATDFINSFYAQKIEENFQGSALYCDNAIRYLTEKDVLISFENKLLIKNNNSVMLPTDLNGLLKARLKFISNKQDASLILGYSAYLGHRLDFELLDMLGIKDIKSAVKDLTEGGWGFAKDNVFYINNYNLIKPVIQSSLKREVEEFLLKNIFAKAGKNLDTTTTALIMGNLAMHKEEYLMLWKNSRFAMSVGDYDAYLKNCFGFLSLIEHIENNISEEEIENNKKEVYQNILMSLYAYSPQKIYSIENVLLSDAIKADDKENIAKLSNLMLQGALISSDYTNAGVLLHNILSGMENPTLMIDGSVNTKFLLYSLVNIEILFNTGDYAQCIDVAKDILSVLQPEIITKIKPASFSDELFINHLLETFRLAAFAKLFLLDNDLPEFFNAVRLAVGKDCPEKNCIMDLLNYLNGQNYAPSGAEYSSPFSKTVYLIMQEFSEHSDDSKTFAQNIYQAKLLASDLHQAQVEMFCDLLIAYSYFNIGLKQKAATIYEDVLDKAEKSAIANIVALAKYFIALQKISDEETDDALLLINDSLAFLHKHNNKILFVLFEKLLISLIKQEEIASLDLEAEEQKLAQICVSGTLSRLI